MNRMRYNCKLCGKKGKYKCTQCGKVSYCSRECQFKDWVNHKKNCHNYNILSLNKRMKSPSNKNDIIITKNDSILNKSINETNSPKDINYTSRNRKTTTQENNFAKNLKPLKQTQVNNTPKFPFMKNIKDIIFMKLNINTNTEQNNDKNFDLFKKILQNKKIFLLYDLLKKHRKYIIENVLLAPKKTYFFASTESFRDKFIEIENYIFNFIFLIKFLYDLGDNVSLFKARQALNYLSKEMLDYKNDGLLTYSINTIFKRCLVIIRSNSVFQNIGYCHEIIKKYLLLISCLIKLSKQLDIPKLYLKYIDHYGKTFELALKVISTSHTTEKIILKSNLLFNIGNLLVQKNLLNSSIKLYKEVINIQSNLEPYSFVFGASYYNISILYYVMGNMKYCEIYLNDMFEEIDRYDEIIKTKKYREDFLRFKCKVLLFSAEVNMEKENYSKAIDNLKEVINNIETTSQKERHKTQQTIIDKKYLLLKTINQEVKKNLDFYGFNISEEKEKNYSPNKGTGLLKDKNRTKNVKFKTKPNDKSSIEYLYEIDFFEKATEKLHFNEKIKEYINGFFDAILFLQNEKENKLRENQHYQKRKRSKRSNSDKKLYRLKCSTVIYEKGGNYNLEGRSFMERTKRNAILCNSLSKSRKKIKSSTLKVFNKRENNLKAKNEKMIEPIEGESRFIHEKTAKKVLSYFNNEITKKVKIINNEGDISDFKYFLMLLANLSYQQLKILNSAQNVNMSPELFNNLPIYFSIQFKNTLNPKQRNLFDKLRLLSLIRCKVLANPNKKISLRNINYSIFHTDVKFNDIKFKQYSDIGNKIREIIDSGYGVYQRRGSTKNDKTIKSEKLFLSSDNSEDIVSDMSKPENNFVKQYITQKSKKNPYLLNLSDSLDSEYRYFKYENKFDIEKFRSDLIEELNSNFIQYSEEEIDNISFLIESPLFVQMMNSLNFDDILDLDEDHTLLFELLKNEIKRIEEYQYEQSEENEEDQKTEEVFLSNDSSKNDIDINIDEDDLDYI